MTSNRKTCSRRRTRRQTTSTALALFAGAAFLTVSPVFAQSCPGNLATARRLVLVTSQNFAAKTGTAHLFERASPQDVWRPVGSPESVRLGRSGMAWGIGFQQGAAPGEPKKIEGDGRTPAGVYPIGASFGFAASPRPGYRQIADDTVCVDDPASPAYNTVTSRKIVGKKVHGENMRKVARYRLGLMVDYPTDAKARGGSCIFIHIQRSPTSSTEGCVALPEDRVAVWQDFSMPGAVLVTLPQEALDRLSGCLPELPN